MSRKRRLVGAKVSDRRYRAPRAGATAAASRKPACEHAESIELRHAPKSFQNVAEGASPLKRDRKHGLRHRGEVASTRWRCGRNVDVPARSARRAEVESPVLTRKLMLPAGRFAELVMSSMLVFRTHLTAVAGRTSNGCHAGGEIPRHPCRAGLTCAGLNRQAVRHRIP